MEKSEEVNNSQEKEEIDRPNQILGKEDLDDQTVAKLRGDAIGETVYSERFVLKTLLNFSDLEWNSDVEQDLCFLWDMTAERDVCEYLFKVSYTKLACAAILENEENRFVEIVIGILANIMCSECEKNISDDEIGIVLNVLSSDDPLILVQVMRFLHALIYIKPEGNFLKPNIYDSLKFILSNCINKDLIQQTLKVVTLLSSNLKYEIVDADFFQAIVIGYEVILENKIENFDHLDFETETIQSSSVELTKIFCNFVAHIDNNKIFDILKQFNDTITIFITNLLIYFSFDENLLPITEQFTYYSEAVSFIYRNLQLPFNKKICEALSQILSILLREDIEEEFKNCAELFCYLISIINVQNGQQKIKDVGNIKTVVDYIKKQAYEFDFDYLDHLSNFLNEIN